MERSIEWQFFEVSDWMSLGDVAPHTLCIYRKYTKIVEGTKAGVIEKVES